METRTVLLGVLLLPSLIGVCAASSARELRQAGSAYPTVTDWARSTGQTFLLELFQTVAPEVVSQWFGDPAWGGTLFALNNRALDMAGMQDGLGDFQAILERATNDSAYAEGIREIALYHVFPDEVLTVADLAALAMGGANLTTAFEGHDIGLLPSPANGEQPASVLLVPEDTMLTRIIGNPEILVPDIRAGSAIIQEIDMLLLPLLELE